MLSVDLLYRFLYVLAEFHHDIVMGAFPPEMRIRIVL